MAGITPEVKWTADDQFSMFFFFHKQSVLDVNLIPIEILKITINSIPSQIHDKLEGQEVPV
jgi:hypothetical protein